MPQALLAMWSASLAQCEGITGRMEANGFVFVFSKCFSYRHGTFVQPSGVTKYLIFAIIEEYKTNLSLQATKMGCESGQWAVVHQPLALSTQGSAPELPWGDTQPNQTKALTGIKWEINPGLPTFSLCDLGNTN